MYKKRHFARKLNYTLENIDPKINVLEVYLQDFWYVELVKSHIVQSENNLIP